MIVTRTPQSSQAQLPDAAAAPLYSCSFVPSPGMPCVGTRGAALVISTSASSFYASRNCAPRSLSSVAYCRLYEVHDPEDLLSSTCVPFPRLVCCAEHFSANSRSVEHSLNTWQWVSGSGTQDVTVILFPSSEIPMWPVGEQGGGGEPLAFVMLMRHPGGRGQPDTGDTS